MAKIIDQDGNDVPENRLPTTVESRLPAQADAPWSWVPAAGSLTRDALGRTIMTLEWTPSNNPGVLQTNHRCPQCNDAWPHSGLCHKCILGLDKQRRLKQAHARLVALHNALDAEDEAIRALPEGELDDDEVV